MRYVGSSRRFEGCSSEGPGDDVVEACQELWCAGVNGAAYYTLCYYGLEFGTIGYVVFCIVLAFGLLYAYCLMYCCPVITRCPPPR